MHHPATGGRSRQEALYRTPCASRNILSSNRALKPLGPADCAVATYRMAAASIHMQNKRSALQLYEEPHDEACRGVGKDLSLAG